MKKIFLFCMMALVAMCGLNSCSDDCNHDFIEVDYSKDIVGTWTCLKADFAEALVFKADGTFASVGVANGKYWDYPDATWSLKGNKLALSSGDYKSNVRLEIIPGNSLALVDEKGNRNVFNYCENDLADEVVGMWVCNDGPASGNKMTIQTFKENGKAIFTGFGSYADVNLVNDETSYKVIGDLLFYSLPKDKLIEGASPYITLKLSYSPNGTAYGDIMGQIAIKENEGEVTSSWLRIKQYLELPDKKYDYNNTYVSNVKGLDEDMTMMGYTFNIGKMEGKNLDKMLKTLLFAVEFPNANTLKYQYHYNGQNIAFEARIVVDGNKVTIKMSEMYPYYRDVDMYMFQDQDNTQLHMYMPTSSFINYFGNMDVAALAFAGEIDVTDAAAVQAIFDRMDERVESINVSFTFKAAK